MTVVAAATVPVRVTTPEADAVLVDPQTSGGRLAGVPAGRAEACLRALLAAGVPAALIGVTEAPVQGHKPIRLAAG